MRRNFQAMRDRADADRVEYERKFNEQETCLAAINDALAEFEKQRAAESTR